MVISSTMVLSRTLSWIVLSILLSLVIVSGEKEEEVSFGDDIIKCFESESWDCFGDGHKVVKKASTDDVNGTSQGESNDIGNHLGTRQDDGKVEAFVLGQSPRTARTIDDDYSSAEDELLAKKLARTIRHPRKIWMAVLSGIVLKLASLVPLILGKLAILGFISVVTSKLSLLIVTMMMLRHMFNGDVKMPGLGDVAGYPGHQQAHQGEFQAGTTMGMAGYPAVQAPHRRWTYYRTTGRQLGGETNV